MARDMKVMIRLVDSVHADLQKAADEVGVTMSAYVAFVLGEHLAQKKRTIDPVLDAIRSEMERLAKLELPSEAQLDTGKSEA